MSELKESSKIIKSIWVLFILVGATLGLQINMIWNPNVDPPQVDEPKCTTMSSSSFLLDSLLDERRGMAEFKDLLRECESQFDYCETEDKCKLLVIKAKAEATF